MRSVVPGVDSWSGYTFFGTFDLILVKNILNPSQNEKTQPNIVKLAKQAVQSLVKFFHFDLG